MSDVARRVILATVLLCTVALSSCEITGIAGPSTVSMGELVTYTLEFSASEGASSGQAWLLAEIPIAWQVAGSVYSGFPAGDPVCGYGNVLETDPGHCAGELPAVPAGYRRVWIQPGELHAVSSGDEGSALLRFSVGSTPGQYTLRFWSVYDAGQGVECPDSPISKEVEVEGSMIPTTQREALVALYYSTDGDNWDNNTGWLGPAGSECTWYGVTCDPAGTGVVELGLSSNGLRGPLPAELQDLTDLEVLFLSANGLTGSIPDWIGNLTALEELFLTENALTGTLPAQLGQLVNLEWLIIGQNPITGTIPPELGNLASLGWLSTFDTELSGSIPPELGDLTSLTYLGLSSCRLSGQIPPALGNLHNLSALFLDGNRLAGSIPDELGNLTALTNMRLTNNQLTGTIPGWIGNLSNLERLGLSGNGLSGTIPSEIGNLGQLEDLGLGRNRLSGEIPSALLGLTNLSRLDLSDNRLSGPIPVAIGALAGSLEWLRLDNNRFTGSIPEGLGALLLLSGLKLAGNQLSGEIPDPLLALGALRPNFVDLRWNAIYTNNGILRDFLDSTQLGGDFESTQTVAPPDVAATALGPGSILVTWSPITYTRNEGAYRVCWAQSPAGSFDSCADTANKTVSWITIDALDPGQPYYFQVQTLSLPHPDNQGTVISEPSEVVSSTTAPAGFAGSLQLSGPEYRAAEGETKTITVRRLGGATGEVSLHYATEGGTATQGGDYTGASGTLTWADGEGGARTFDVSVTDDAVPEGEETVVLSLSDPTGGAVLGNPITSTLLISDNDLSEEDEGDASSVGSEPSVATDPLGNRVVVWTETRPDGSGSDILAQLYDPDGVSVGPRFKVNGASQGEHHSAEVEHSAVGGFAVVWVSSGTTKGLAQQTGDAVFCRFFDSNGQPLSDDVVVDDGSHGAGASPDVAVEPDSGRAAIVWKRAVSAKTGGPIEQGGADTIFARLFDPTGGAISQSITVDDGTQGEPDAPAVASNPAGQVVVAWERLGPDGTSDVFARTLDLPKSLAGPEILVSSEMWRDQGEPSVVVDDEGGFVVAWQGPSEPDDAGEREPGTDVFARGFDADSAPVQAQFRVNTSEPGTQKEPELVMSPDGDCWAAWASEDTSGVTGVFARQLPGCTTPPKGLVWEIQVNDATDGLATRTPSASLDGTGALTVVYVKDDVVEGDWGVFGRALGQQESVCTPGATTLCLNNARFRVEVDWVAFDGASGPGQAVQLTADTGYFWFFYEANVEMVVKVLDGTWMNGYYWVFYGALSNVEYTMTVTDTETGNVKTYFNPSGTFASAGDTEALPGDGKRASAQHSGSIAGMGRDLAPGQVWRELLSPTKMLDSCTPGAHNLCLNNDRFRVEVDWVDFEGVPGQGNAVPLTGDTGYFWFFDSANVELIVKVLDGRAINGHYWVFYGALSNVEYTITVTDTDTGEVKEYVNPAHTFASVGDTEAFAVP